MDILSARKKAAASAKARQEAADAATPAQTPREPEAVAPPAALVEPAPAVLAPAPVEPAPERGTAGEPAGEVSQKPSGSAEARKDARSAAPEGTEAEEQELEMLSFRLGAESYVLPINEVNEVLKLRDITPVPHAPDYILGVCSLRGAVLTIVDLGRRLGIVGARRDEKSRIIVVAPGGGDECGLLVDRVSGVVRFSRDMVRPAPETMEQGAEAGFIKAIARKNDSLYILLDAEKAVGHSGPGQEHEPGR